MMPSITKITVSLLSLFALSSAAPAEDMTIKRAVSSTCPSYTIINTRGTGERQGQSSGFRTMNSQITSQLSGGKIYNTVYPAGFSQNSASGTRDIIDKITTTLQSSPNECFILQGYSQGAAATVNAMSSITGNAFDAVKGVFLIGDPHHKSGLACNIDNNGGTTTQNVSGLSATLTRGIPDNWVSKTADVCILGDGVCDTTNGNGINAQHLQYPRDSSTQRMGASFALEKLGGQ
ncbi:A cutinase-like protein from cryptococcus Sp [Xylaria bambusicola]|uniref:A cutinase-like protein from cryptococcus Sp n=1 Tax=Xylaria bambusicola TaxID=326684 RepID=UPI0020076DEA|nr:A cutinase-like protein from cryptococcus Sp [Xylaria bambusicola]KAI0522150.1 A cutinase-like protein from cryptococcus Sp [Xylaria bambusicola]